MASESDFSLSVASPPTPESEGNSDGSYWVHFGGRNGTLLGTDVLLSPAIRIALAALMISFPYSSKARFSSTTLLSGNMSLKITKSFNFSSILGSLFAFVSTIPLGMK